MTTTEMSNEFDVLYNNITSNQAPGLDEYEKSVFLTLAQDEILKSYFDPKQNKPQEGFDGSERRQIDFSTLMTTVKAIPSEAENHLHPDSLSYLVPGNILYYINEQLTVIRGTTKMNLTVVPLSYVEFNRIMSKPYKRPLKWQAWRMITSGDGGGTQLWDYEAIAQYINTVLAKHSIHLDVPYIRGIIERDLHFWPVTVQTDDGEEVLYVVKDNGQSPAQTLVVNRSNAQILRWADHASGTDIEVRLTAEQVAYVNTLKKFQNVLVEIVPAFKSDLVSSYTVRYVRRPNPIVLVTLQDSDDLSLNGGVKNQAACELDPILHHEIVLRAVELAKASYTGELNSMLALGVNSGTPMGMVSSGRSRED